MAKISFIDHQGAERVVNANVGASVMQAATANGVPGIDADCGGECACATCQVYVDDDWLAATGDIGEREAGMLEFADGVKPNSRLACRITVTDKLDGLVVHTPERQN